MPPRNENVPDLFFFVSLFVCHAFGGKVCECDVDIKPLELINDLPFPSFHPFLPSPFAPSVPSLVITSLLPSPLLFPFAPVPLPSHVLPQNLNFGICSHPRGLRQLEVAACGF